MTVGKQQSPLEGSLRDRCLLWNVTKTKSSAVDLSNIGFPGNFTKVFHHMEQFIVARLPSPFKNRNTVVEVERERVHVVVKKHNILQLSVLNHAQVLDEEAVLGHEAVVATEESVEVLSLRIEGFGHECGVVERRGCEHHDFVQSRHLVQEDLPVWTSSYPQL